MKKTLIISGIECSFKSSAAIPRMYRLKFGRDIFVDMQKLKRQIENHERRKAELMKEAEKEGETISAEAIESNLPIDTLEMFENIAFLMHKHGDPEQPSDINEWLEQFETFDVYTVLPEILQMWNLENKQTSVLKKKIGT